MEHKLLLSNNLVSQQNIASTCLNNEFGNSKNQTNPLKTSPRKKFWVKTGARQIRPDFFLGFGFCFAQQDVGFTAIYNFYSIQQWFWKSKKNPNPKPKSSEKMLGKAGARRIFLLRILVLGLFGFCTFQIRCFIR